MKMTVHIKKEKFDKEGWLKALKAATEDVAREAGKAFAEAALLKIPVRTGFVAGAFGGLVGLVGASAGLNPAITTVLNTLGSAEYYYPGGGQRVLKTPEAGLAYATPVADIFKWIGNNYTFTFDIDITYFRINESASGNSPTAPWEAFESGQAAYIDYIQENLRSKLPKVREYISINSETV